MEPLSRLPEFEVLHEWLTVRPTGWRKSVDGHYRGTNTIENQHLSTYDFRQS
jgi:hypothetical protein